MGALALSMVGIVSLAPVLANILKPIVGPVYSALGADPAMFATTLLANDMGGYPLAMSLAQDPNGWKICRINIRFNDGSNSSFHNTSCFRNYRKRR